MATQWHYRLNDGRESDAVSFRELADLIQAGALNRTSLVHPHYDTEWCVAEDVVGLIYTAKNASDEAAVSRPREDLPESGTTGFSRQLRLADDDTVALGGAEVPFFRRCLFWLLDLFVLVTGRRDASCVGESVSAAVAAGRRIGVAGLPEYAREGSGAPAVSVAEGPIAARNGRDAFVADNGDEETTSSQSSSTPVSDATVFDLEQLLSDGMLAAVEEVPSTAEIHYPDIVGATSQGVPSLDAGCVDSSSEGLTDVMEDAIRDWDVRQERSECESRFGRTLARWLPGRIADWMGPQSALLVFRVLAAIVSANLSILAIEAMASSESRRFPGWMESQNLRSFPLIGECSHFEFWFLAIDVGLTAAVAVFLLTRRLAFSSNA